MKKNKETILIVEDDPTMMRGLRDNFEFKGYDVRCAFDGIKGFDLAIDSMPDLIILDIMLPGMNGYEICKALRERGLNMPIIMLTAKDKEDDVILGLNIGADDYVTKPFSIKQLLARVEAFLRRNRKEKQITYNFGSYTFDNNNQTLTRDDNCEITLTPKEAKLLSLLIKKPGRVYTRNFILDTIWGFNAFVSTRSVDRCVTTLRKKLETPDNANHDHIITIREVGYKFNPESLK